MPSSLDPDASSSDRLLVAVSDDGKLRARIAFTSNTVTEARLRHQTGPLASLALARALTTVAVFPHDDFKDADRVSFQWSGSGPLRTVFAELRAPGLVRGYVTRPAATFGVGPLDTREHGLGLLPGGALSVVKQAPSGAFSQAHVPLDTGEIDEDAEDYFNASLQVATRLRTLVKELEHGAVQSVGVLVQRLPSGEDAPLPDADALLAFDLATADAEEKLLDLAFSGRPYRVLSTSPLSFSCPCSRQRISSGLRAFSVAELETLRDEDNGAEVRCDFCAEEYTFTRDDIDAIITEKTAN